MPEEKRNISLVASGPRGSNPIRLNHWIPRQNGIAPRIRIGRRWINTQWGLPIAAATLLCLTALAQSLRELPGVEAFFGQHCAGPAIG